MSSEEVLNMLAQQVRMSEKLERTVSQLQTAVCAINERLRTVEQVALVSTCADMTNGEHFWRGGSYCTCGKLDREAWRTMQDMEP